MNAQHHLTQRDRVRASLQVDASNRTERHNCYAIRKPVLCSVCELPSSVRNGVCDGCNDAWYQEGHAA
jgi:hypothetical protein